MQSLLERNKQLLAKTQAFENFVADCDEKVSIYDHNKSDRLYMLLMLMQFVHAGRGGIHAQYLIFINNHCSQLWCSSSIY